MTLVSLLTAAGSTNHSRIRLTGKTKQHMHRVGPFTDSAKFFSGQNLITALYPLMGGSMAPTANMKSFGDRKISCLCPESTDSSVVLPITYLLYHMYYPISS